MNLVWVGGSNDGDGCDKVRVNASFMHFEVPLAEFTLEQRRHQRVRFGHPPPVVLGSAGWFGEANIENLSLSGLMIRCTQPVTIGQILGCEFSVAGAPLVDLPIQVVSRLGDVFGARFMAGPLSQILIEETLLAVMENGLASLLTVHDRSGQKVMRILGGLNAALHNDFMHALTRMAVVEIDLAGVSRVDAAGLTLCRLALQQGVTLGAQSPVFTAAWLQDQASRA